MKHFVVSHRSTYRYAEPVIFGPHRMMIRPRDSHQLRLISASLTTSLAADLIWTYDIFGNVVCTAYFAGSSSELMIESRLEVQHYAGGAPILFANGGDVPNPPAYTGDEIADLGARLAAPVEPLAPELEVWALDTPMRHPGGAVALLTGLCQEIQATFAYEVRFEQSTRHANETFALRSGACRDLAALFIAVARRLGYGAQFVSGYLFDPPPEDSAVGMRGAGATHAWAEVYLPSIGWIEFDPTNGLIQSDRLIKVAVAREPHQAIPISGSFTGSVGSFVGLWVGVDVENVRQREGAVQKSGEVGSGEVAGGVAPSSYAA